MRAIVSNTKANKHDKTFWDDPVLVTPAHPKNTNRIASVGARWHPAQRPEAYNVGEMTRRFACSPSGSPRACRSWSAWWSRARCRPVPADVGPGRICDAPARDDRPLVPGIAGVVNFADVAERLNPAVVNIDASSRSRRSGRQAAPPNARPSPSRSPRGSLRNRRRGETPRRGAGTGFIIDDEGHILTNHHVIENAERITVKLTDGRSLRADVIGSDPDTDIALIKLDARPSSRMPRWEIPTSCAWASGCARSAIRSRTSTR